MGRMVFAVASLTRQERSVFGWELCLKQKRDYTDIIVIDSYSMLDQLKAHTSDISDLYTSRMDFCPPHISLSINTKYCMLTGNTDLPSKQC